MREKVTIDNIGWAEIIEIDDVTYIVDYYCKSHSLNGMTYEEMVVEDIDVGIDKVYIWNDDDTRTIISIDKNLESKLIKELSDNESVLDRLEEEVLNDRYYNDY